MYVLIQETHYTVNKGGRHAVSVTLTSSQWGFQSVPGGPAEVHSRSGIGPHCSLLLELDYGTGLPLLRHPTLGKETEHGMKGIRQVAGKFTVHWKIFDRCKFS